MANSVLAKLAVQISANTAEFNKSLQKTQKDVSAFTQNISKVAGAVGIAFGTQQVVDFALEISKLAGEADGVRKAFEKLPDNKRLMEQLTAATAGTVSELELMKRTVQASNFGISLSALPKLLEFAAVRAQQTGQSIDYLVDSIVTGIGRKSPLILDNLGISAVALKEKLNGVSTEAATVGQVAEAVGKIASESLQNMGTLAENTSTKMQRLNAAWENFKVTLGTTVNNSGVLNFLLELSTEALQGLTPMEELNHALSEFNRYSKEGERAPSFKLDELKKRAEEAGKKIVLLTDSVTGLTRAIIDPRTPMLSKNIKDVVKPAEQAAAAVQKLAYAVKQVNTEMSVSGLGVLQKIEKPKTPFIFGKEEEDAIYERLNKSMNRIRTTVRETSEAIAIDISGLLASATVDLVEGITGAVTGVGNFGKAILQTVIGFAKEFGKILIAAGFAALQLKSLLKNPATAIAAGVALLAVAGIASAAVSRAQSNAFGGPSGPQSAASSNNFGRSTNVQFQAQFKIEGRDLIAVVDKNNTLDKQRR